MEAEANEKPSGAVLRFDSETFNSGGEAGGERWSCYSDEVHMKCQFREIIIGVINITQWSYKD